MRYWQSVLNITCLLCGILQGSYVLFCMRVLDLRTSVLRRFIESRAAVLGEGLRKEHHGKKAVVARDGA